MSHQDQKEKLAKIASNLAIKYKEQLEKLKCEYDELKRDDFIWHYLLQSFSTMGNSAGWHGLIENKNNYSKITFGELEKLDALQRKNVVLSVCRAAKIRMPSKKAEFIFGCYDHIQKLGGVQSANKALHQAQGREPKIKFLMNFPGIGPKYARNIMMDVYHEDFRDSIAIDVRIKGISTTLGVSFNNYTDHENFFLDAAKLAGLNGWEMDRLLYNYRGEFENEIANAS